MSALITLQKLTPDELIFDVITQAADLFSSAYGVWGPQAYLEVSKYCKQGIQPPGPFDSSYPFPPLPALHFQTEEDSGHRVKMPPNKLRDQILPEGENNIFVRAMVGNDIVGHAFATRWECEGSKIIKVCWITQLIVKEWRRKGVATRILLEIKEGANDQAFGILNSHPAAIMAASRAFGNGIEAFHCDVVRRHGHAIMASSPVTYVKTATRRGNVFGDDRQDGSVCCAFTDFWVDHMELLVVRKSVEEKGVRWPLGELPEGCEFLVIGEVTDVPISETLSKDTTIF